MMVVFLEAFLAGAFLAGTAEGRPEDFEAAFLVAADLVLVLVIMIRMAGDRGLASRHNLS